MTTATEPTVYELIARLAPIWEGASVIAILDADGHHVVCPVSPLMMDDAGMDQAVVDVMISLLEGRRLSRAKHADG